MNHEVPADLLEIVHALLPGAPLDRALLAADGNVHHVVLLPGVAAVRISKRAPRPRRCRAGRTCCVRSGRPDCRSPYPNRSHRSLSLTDAPPSPCPGLTAPHYPRAREIRNRSANCYGPCERCLSLRCSAEPWPPPRRRLRHEAGPSSWPRMSSPDCLHGGALKDDAAWTTRSRWNRSRMRSSTATSPAPTSIGARTASWSACWTGTSRCPSTPPSTPPAWPGTVGTRSAPPSTTRPTGEHGSGTRPSASNTSSPSYLERPCPTWTVTSTTSCPGSNTTRWTRS